MPQEKRQKWTGGEACTFLEKITFSYQNAFSWLLDSYMISGIIDSFHSAIHLVYIYIYI